ncbi:hypothetical protein PTSG_00923 [Salpingoeca rosetta]|uniref:DAGKc domain-containing protein n=1 Tax=Salpingoeca rosetta (strain ATCC 50818 / BSB-021) TaxID=946362 RepID=F2TXW1_SALR5|nr:uncharacterized protein PTSG_00923 [Salpingoeca rosetta]EGD76220.1 hypothetical protein PTSG_00923 [Salpingoeca rosetta]|eukprot:XP_004998395.1 hypothetical protein PTSG_00923 [Salpingoeca rosetta]
MLLLLWVVWYRLLAFATLGFAAPVSVATVPAPFTPITPAEFITMADQGQVVLTEEVKHDNKPVTVKITTNELIVVPQTRRTTKAGYLSFDDVYGVQSGTNRRGQPMVEVYALLHRGKKRVDRIVPMACQSTEQAQRIVTTIRAVLAGVEPGAELPRRHLLVLVNPFGGTRKAPKIYENTLVPMFTRAALSHDVVNTTHQGHAKELMQGLDLDKYDGVVCVSGDGLLNEAVNGLMSRDDGDRARQMPLGLVPAGSGNGLCKCIATNTPEEAAHNIIKGNTAPMDLVRIEQQGAPANYSFLQVSLGLLADVDIESERLLSWFMTPEAAKHVGAPCVKYAKVKAVRFESAQNRGILNVDGEVIETKETQLSAVPGAVKLMVPAGLQQPDWDISRLPEGGMNVHNL